MAVRDFGCHEPIDVKDDGSDISEQCFQENHRGDSRKWLIRDGQVHDRRFRSTMKTTYQYPYEEQREYVGKRRAATIKKLFDEAEAEIIKERNEPPSVEKYCTEYDRIYNSNIEVRRCDNEEDLKKELYQKYPLYTSNAASFWNFKLEKHQKSNVHFPGLTNPIDLKNPFKRHSEFTKPLDEVLDNYIL